MSNNHSNEPKSATAHPEHSPSPDGKSALPDVLPDFPQPGNGDPGPSSAPVPK